MLELAQIIAGVRRLNADKVRRAIEGATTARPETRRSFVTTRARPQETRECFALEFVVLFLRYVFLPETALRAMKNETKDSSVATAETTGEVRGLFGTASPLGWPLYSAHCSSLSPCLPNGQHSPRDDS